MLNLLLLLGFICAVLLVGTVLDKDFWTPLPYLWCPIHYDEPLTDRGWCRLCKKAWKL